MFGGDIWANLINGFSVVLTPQHLLFVAIGVVIGAIRPGYQAAMLPWMSSSKLTSQIRYAGTTAARTASVQ